MRKRFVGLWTPVLSAAFLAASQAHAASTPISPIFTDPVTGYRYQLLSQADWTDSEAEALALGGQLPTINSAEQNSFLLNTFGDYQGTQRILWTGLYDPTEDKKIGSIHANDFVWASGAPLTYTDWDAGEPDDAADSEFWVAIYYPNYNNPGSWNDWSDRISDPIGIQFDGVVQLVPEPCSGLTCGLLLLTAFRRPERGRGDAI